jgi:hypothetical protein
VLQYLHKTKQASPPKVSATGRWGSFQIIKRRAYSVIVYDNYFAGTGFFSGTPLSIAKNGVFLKLFNMKIENSETQTKTIEIQACFLFLCSTPASCCRTRGIFWSSRFS